MNNLSIQQSFSILVKSFCGNSASNTTTEFVNVALSALMAMELLSLFLPLQNSTRRVLFQVRVMKQEGPPGQLLLKCRLRYLKIQVPRTRLVYIAVSMAPQFLQGHIYSRVFKGATAVLFAERNEIRHWKNLAVCVIQLVPVFQSSKFQIFFVFVTLSMYF